MEKTENPQEPAQTHPPISQTKSQFTSFYLIPVSILLLAFIFTFTQSALTSELLSPSNSTLSSNPNPSFIRTRNPNAPYCVLWMAPFLSGGGYSSEAWSYITSIHENIQNPQFKLSINHHGDLQYLEFWEGLNDYMRNLALGLHQTQCRLSETIVVCHSEPGAWNPPSLEFRDLALGLHQTRCRPNETIANCQSEPGALNPPLFHSWTCPPSRRYKDFLAVIGRTMFETDRLNIENVKRCNKMDRVWVPTDFHVSSFIQSGVEKSKVIKLVQPVDVDFFDPEKYTPLHVNSLGKLILGNPHASLENEFVFLSVFKWEYRKGWDVLLKAYLKEFSSADNVSLYLLTNPYHTEGDFDNKIMRFVEDDSELERPNEGWARIYVIDRHVNQVDLPRLYKSADAFVLPSRGEGWGRPIVEAMAMALPVIATNWSGPTEFLSEENSFPLEVDRMSEVMEGPFKGHLWAEPKVDQLQVLMRHVMNNPEEAKGKGRRAREDMITRFSPEIVAEIVSGYIHAVIHDKISGIN